MSLQEARKRIPELNGLSDESALNVIHQVYYPNMPKAELASRLGYKPPKTEPEIKSPGLMRNVLDAGLALGQGVVGAGKMLSDLAGADNVVSQGLDSASGGLENLKSQESRDERAYYAQKIKEAEGSGSTWDQIKAHGSQVIGMPGESIAQGVGSFATMGIGKAVQAMRFAQAAKQAGMTKEAFAATAAGKAALDQARDVGFKANLGVGVGMGVGAAKGSQFQQTYDNAIAQGMPEPEAQALADEAQRYGGQGTMQQMLGGGLGFVAAKTGPIEKLIAGKSTGAGGLMQRTLGGGAVEFTTEGVQGGQERYAGNDAAIASGVLDESKRWTGVAGQGVAEGMIGGTMGAGAGALGGSQPGAALPEQDQAPAEDPGQTAANAVLDTKLVPETGPMTRAANVATAIEADKVRQEVNQRLTTTSMADMLRGPANPLQDALAAQGGAVAEDSSVAQPADLVPDAGNMVGDQVEQPLNMVPNQSEQPLDMVPQGVGPATGEVLPPAAKPEPLDFTGKTDDELRQARKAAQDPTIRKALATELQARRAAAAPVADKPATLPTNLAGAKEGYNYGKKAFNLTFDNDIDRAAYITALTKPDGKRSAKDADYLKFALDATGMTEAEVRAHGQKVKDSIKAQAKGAEPGALKVPGLYAPATPPATPLRVPEQESAAKSADPDVTLTNEGKTGDQDQKARWLKAINDENRLTGGTGVQLSVTEDGKLTYLGDPGATQSGRRLLKVVDEARKAGATNADIAASIRAAKPITPETGKAAQPAPAQAPAVTAESGAPAKAIPKKMTVYRAENSGRGIKTDAISGGTYYFDNKEAATRWAGDNGTVVEREIDTDGAGIQDVSEGELVHRGEPVLIRRDPEGSGKILEVVVFDKKPPAAPVAKTATKKDANAIFGGKALADQKNAVPPNGKALDEFSASGKQAEFDALLKMRRTDKASLTEEQENRFFDLRAERNKAVAAVENAALGRVGQKPVTQPVTSGVPEEGAGGSQPPQAAPNQDQNSPQSQWTRATTNERIAIARAVGIQLKPAENVAKKAWDEHGPVAQEKLARGLQKQEAAPKPEPVQAVPILQNRNRATPSSIAQMQSIAGNPDYGRLGFSRDFANGAPVVTGGQINPDRLGKTDVAVASDGRRIPVQYAVVEASDVLASNNADGTPNQDYGNQAVQRIRAIAGNGRIAGLQAAHGKGTTKAYQDELTADTLHGVNPEVIRAMRAPVLVRVMPSEAVTDDIGDVSNTTGNLNLSPVEQANNDAQRVSLDALQFAEDGGITPETVRQFVRAMPQAEQGGLIDTDGQPTKQAVDRINAAVFAKAYGNDGLVRLFAQAQDPDARLILSALAQVAPKMARLEGMGALDIREIVTQAAEIAVNARRDGKSLARAAQQMDMAADPLVGVVLELFANNPRAAKPVVDSLGKAADFAYTEATKPAEDMFGEVPRASREDVINQLRPENEQRSQESLEQPAGRGPVQVDAGRASAQQPAAANPEPAQASGPAEAEGLTAPTPDDIRAQQDRAAQAEADKKAADTRAEQEEARERERAEVARRSEAAADTFELGQDPMANLTGQQDIFGAPAAAAKNEQAKPKSDADRWQAMPKAEREALAQKIGRNGAFATGLAANDWEKIAPSIKANLLKAMGPVQEAPEPGGEVIQKLRALVATALANGNENQTVVLSHVSVEDVALLQREGVPVEDGFVHTADMFAVRHAINRHGDEKAEAKHGQIPLTEEDIAALPKIIKEPDALVLGAKTKRGQDIVGSLKRLPDGTVLYLEEVRSGRKTLAMTSMRKFPGTTDFETIKNRIVPSYAQSDTGDVRIIYPDGELGQGAKVLWDGSEPTPAATGQQPAFATTADAAPESVSSQGSSNARGQVDSLPAQPDAGKPAKIEDSGEVLEGARKLYAKSYAAKLDEGTGMETASVPLSKSWPEPDYQRLIDEGADPWAVSMARAARDEVPAKPGKPWKLKGWVAKVDLLRGVTQKVMAGEYTKEQVLEKIPDGQLQGWLNKVDLYQAVGHANSLKDMKFEQHEYGMYGGQVFKPAKKLWTIGVESTSASATYNNGRWGNDLVVADTKAEAIEKFKVWTAEQAAKAEDSQGKPAGKRTEFHVYRYRNNPKVFIVGKRLSATKSIDLIEFESSKEAQAFIAANQDKLEAMLTEAKAEQSERSEENAPRVGDDHRQGADVTTDQFREAFGFRGEQFGASMPQAERQANMNQAYDALMDLAGVIGVPPKALSLNGELGLAFGARGHGGKNPAMAHYERDTTGAVTPNRVVINLTRKNGAGSLAHEWFHAVDNYFARMRGEKGGMLTESYPAKREGVRPEMVDAFKRVMDAIQASGVRERSKNLDKKRTKDYWSTGLEMAARSFESYVIAKLQDKSGANDYLANILPESAWLREGSYPYPTMGELPLIRAAFDNFFATVQTKDTDKGVAMFSRGPVTQPQGQTQTPAFKKWFGDSKVVDAEGKPLVVYHGTPNSFEQFDQKMARENGFFFTADPEHAEQYAGASGSKMPVYLSLKNPMRVYGSQLPSRASKKVINGMIADEKDSGHDGIVIERFRDHIWGLSDTYIAFNPTQIKSATGNDGSFDQANPDIRMSRSPATQQAYEARIDALFAGEKADRKGAVLLDSSDIMGLLNHAKAPMVLNEKHLIDGLTNHPEMTAKQWKRVPGWLENPAAVYTDPKHPGRLTVIASELVAGYPVVMAVEPNPESTPQGHNGPIQLLVTAFAKTTGGLPPIGVLASSGRLLYADTKMAPIAWKNIGDNPRAFNPSVGANKILTEKNLSGYRKAQDPALSRTQGAGMTQVDAEDVVTSITSRWANAPEVVVVQDMNDPAVPEAVRKEDAKQKSQGASGEPEGFWYGGKAYIVAGALQSPGNVMRVLFHETLGHYGLRGTFGDGLTPILKQLAALRRTEVEAKAKQYGLDMSIEADRLTAAEEVLAELAQSRPDLGFVKKAVAAIRAWIRKNIPFFSDIQLTDDEIVRSYIIPARAFVERGPGGKQKGGVSFSRSEDAQPLDVLRQADDLFAMPKSKGMTIAEIIQDHDPEITVKEVKIPGNETFYNLTMADGTTARITVRKSGPSSVYDSATDGDNNSSFESGRPGENPEDVDPYAEDVWIDVSRLKPGQNGIRVYSIASTFAHNTGRIFIGDPNGLSDEAMRRRAENMLSSALKFGTTKHLAPHPSQTVGGAGVPALKWVYGDDVGNIERLIDLNLKALDNANPYAKDLSYDLETGTFSDARTGRQIARSELAAAATQRRGRDGSSAVSQAGWRTIARGAVFRAILGRGGAQGNGAGRSGASGRVLDGLVRQRAQLASPIKDERVFYSRSVGTPQLAGQVRDKLFDVSGATGNTLAHYRGMALQALGRRQLVDLYGDMLPQLKQYDELVQRMDAEKNDSAAEADAIANEWGNLDEKAMIGVGPVKLPIGTPKYPGMERKLAELMHDATLAQMDPDKPLQDGDNPSQHAALKAKFAALSPNAQSVYRRARDMYEAHYAKVREAIQERIMRSELGASEKKAMIARMDADFFQKTKGVYFPLARFGKYVMVVKDADGKTVNVSRAETLNEAETTRKMLLREFDKSKGYAVTKVMKEAEFNRNQDMVGKGFVTDLFAVLDKQGVDDALRDSVSQLYLSSLPDLSWAKHGIHRKGTPGFSQDARRAFAQNVFHGARYLAKLRYSDQLQNQLTAMEDHIKVYEGVDEYDGVKAQQVADEMVKRHDNLMSPDTNPLSTALTSVGFVWFLGVSPAAAMVNLSQTALVAYPVMGAKWGYDKAASALLLASKQTVQAKNDISKVLKGDELDAYNRAVADGTIDVTMAHDLAGISQGEDAKVTWALRPVMKVASFLFHHAERFNRQATFIAAYRLARESGAGLEAAFEQAKKATYDGHFDYGSSNRPRIMQGNVAKVVFLFKQYGQNMVYTLSRQAYLATQSLNPKERAEARKQLGGILALHAAAAGALGLPLVGALLSAASFIGSDDDEPWDAEVALKNAMADAMGPKAAEVMAHGLSRLTPWDLSGRVALNKLILPDVQEGLEGQRWAEAMSAAALGPVFGIVTGMAKGLQEMGEGRYQRGLENMLPMALRNPVKALRYHEEGAVDKSGVAIKDEVSIAGVLGQASGFSPSEVRAATEVKSAIYQHDRARMDRRKSLMAQFAQAQMAGDSEGMQEMREAIAKFNAKNPKIKITPRQLIQSVRNRERRIEDAEKGVYLPKNRRDAIEAVRFGE